MTRLIFWRATGSITVVSKGRGGPGGEGKRGGGRLADRPRFEYSYMYMYICDIYIEVYMWIYSLAECFMSRCTPHLFVMQTCLWVCISILKGTCGCIHLHSPIYLVASVSVCTANPTWGDIFESSKLKARTSLLPRFNEKRRSSFELWAFETAFENVTPNGIGCTCKHVHGYVYLCYLYWSVHVDSFTCIVLYICVHPVSVCMCRRVYGYVYLRYLYWSVHVDSFTCIVLRCGLHPRICLYVQTCLWVCIFAILSLKCICECIHLHSAIYLGAPRICLYVQACVWCYWYVYTHTCTDTHVDI